MKNFKYTLVALSILVISTTLFFLSCSEDSIDVIDKNELAAESVLKTTYYNTSTFNESNFNNGSISPFYECTTQSPNYVKVISGRVKCFWDEDYYNGTRMTKGAEICSNLDFYSEGFMGFYLYVPGTSGDWRFPSDKTTTIAQIFAENGCSSWAAMLEIRNNDLYISHRPACVSPTVAKIVSNIPRNTYLPIIVRFVPSHTNHGAIEIRYNGNLVYSKKGINFAWGVWQGNSDILDSSVSDNMIKLKLGMYCHDSDNYSNGETRTIYFDNVSMRIGSNGWTHVDPTN